MIKNENLAAANLLENAYEDLREQALSGLRQTQGLALFLSRGLTAWILAWSQCFAPQVQREPVVANLQIAVQPEVTQLLANMVLCHGGLSL